MGHLVGKDLYRKLGKKIDGLMIRAPWNETLYAILKELYTEEEADVVAKMPYGLSTLDQIETTTKYDRAKLQNILEHLAEKGLVMDVWLLGGYRYMISPMVIGIFEFTMMRTRGELKHKEWAALFNAYMHGDDAFYKANFKPGTKISPMRVLPYEDAIDTEEFVEVLDYEKASAIVDMHTKFSIGICSCRHEKLHAGIKECDVPLETCSTFGHGADWVVNHGFGKSVSKEEMWDNLARSKELGLVLSTDASKQDLGFMCHCCGCCCNILLGISKFGYPNTILTSTFIAECNEDSCSECGTCAEACPIDAITMPENGAPMVDTSICIGCGVCGLQCTTGAMRLIKRKQRVLHPEDTMERVILQCLERGTLQNQMFSDPGRLDHKFMRAAVGGFLKLPSVKSALMSDMLRSRFLGMMRKGA
jgi:ferredoxin